MNKYLDFASQFYSSTDRFFFFCQIFILRTKWMDGMFHAGSANQIYILLKKNGIKVEPFIYDFCLKNFQYTRISHCSLLEPSFGFNFSMQFCKNFPLMISTQNNLYIHNLPLQPLLQSRLQRSFSHYSCCVC